MPGPGRSYAGPVRTGWHIVRGSAVRLLGRLHGSGAYRVWRRLTSALQRTGVGETVSEVAAALLSWLGDGAAARLRVDARR